MPPKGSSPRLFNKDKQMAMDVTERLRRVEERRARRAPTWSSGLGQVPAAGPIARGPLLEGLAQRTADERHAQRVHEVFTELDRAGLGEVGLSELRASFLMLHIAMDERTFDRYVGALLPLHCDAVSREDFTRFHQAVWANQPGAVKRMSGIYLSAVSDDGDRPRVTKSASSGCLVQEARQNEDTVRVAFSTYNQGRGYVARREMPGLVQGLGFDPELARGVRDMRRIGGFSGWQVAKADAVDDGQVSFHEFVDYQNRFISMVEASRGPNLEDDFRRLVASTPALQR